MELIIGANTIVPTSKLQLNIQIFGVDLSEIDFSVYILSSNNQKVRGDDDMIFYGQLHNKAHTVSLSQVNNNSVKISGNLSSIDADVGKVAICATMANEPDTFSNVNRLQLKLNENDKTILTANILGQHRTEVALIIGEFYKHQQNWKFRLVAQGFNGGLKPLAEYFGVEIANESYSSELEANQQQSINNSNVAPNITDTLKDIFSSPLKMIEKRKNLKDFQKILTQYLRNGQLSNHEIQQLTQFCTAHNLDRQEAVKSCEKQINDFILFAANHQNKETLNSWGNFLNVSNNIMNQVYFILNKKLETQFKDLLSEVLANGQLATQGKQQLDQFCIIHSLDKQTLFNQSSLVINNFLHFILANIIADHIVEQDEINLINSLCAYFKPSQKILEEISTTIQRVNEIAKIRKGDVLSIQTNEIILKNTEIVYLHQKDVSITIRRKNTKNNEYYRGDLFVTSERIIYKSAKPQNIPIVNIIAFESNKNVIFITSKTATQSGEFYIGKDAEFVEAYIEQAVKRFHRQLDLRQSTNDSRYISQEIRNIVWQRCNGQCVECSSTSYLEFDHIIPFSKGGSNSANNLQLLCRACNLNKSDRI